MIFDKQYYKTKGFQYNVVFWLEEIQNHEYNRHEIVYRTIIENNIRQYSHLLKENHKDVISKHWIEENCDHITDPNEIKRLNKKRLLLRIS